MSKLYNGPLCSAFGFSSGSISPFPEIRLKNGREMLYDPILAR